VDTGDITVWVPQTADVDLTCRAGVGDLQCLGRTQDGADNRIEVTDNGSDGVGGLRINLTARAGVGHVEVHRRG
jgi:predicted membrane protein